MTASSLLQQQAVLLRLPLPLPHELLDYITTFFSKFDATVALRVSREFHDLFAPRIWRNLESLQHEALAAEFARCCTMHDSLSRYGHLVRALYLSSATFRSLDGNVRCVPNITRLTMKTSDRLAEFLPMASQLRNLRYVRFVVDRVHGMRELDIAISWTQNEEESGQVDLIEWQNESTNDRLGNIPVLIKRQVHYRVERHVFATRKFTSLQPWNIRALSTQFTKLGMCSTNKPICTTTLNRVMFGSEPLPPSLQPPQPQQQQQHQQQPNMKENSRYAILQQDFTSVWRFYNLKTLHLALCPCSSEMYGFNDFTSDRLPSLQSLIIEVSCSKHHKQVTTANTLEATLTSIFSNSCWPRLSHISFSSKVANHIQDALVSSLYTASDVSTLPQLAELKLILEDAGSVNSELCTVVLDSIAAAVPQLRKLSVNYEYQSSANGMSIMRGFGQESLIGGIGLSQVEIWARNAVPMRYLSTLSLVGVQTIGSRALGYIIQHCPRLIVLELINTKLSDQTIDAVAGVSGGAIKSYSVREILLRHRGAEIVGGRQLIKFLGFFPSLTMLHLHDYYEIYSDKIATTLPSLGLLTVNGKQYTRNATS